MFSRVIFILITLLWVTMNVLLWRAEYGSRTATGSPVPVETVWKKVLNAPDLSPLKVLLRGRSIGACQVQTSVAEELSKLSEAPKNGMNVKSRIRLEGSLQLKDGDKFRRLRIQCDLSLSGKQEWEQFNLRLVYRPVVLEVHSTASAQAVQVRATDGEVDFERTFKFSEFQDPMALLNDISGSFMDGPFGQLDFPVTAGQSAPHTPVFKWEAVNDTLTIEHTSVHVYRLETKLADRYNVAIFVSRAGEILKAELPDGITLLHDKLSNP